MENTLSNKAKFFAQYWGQKVFYSILYGSIVKCESYYLHRDNIQDKDYLELKPLSSITCEDAFEVAKIVSPMLFEGNGEKGGHFIDKSEIKSGWISVKHKQKVISVDIDLDGSVFEYHEDESYMRPSLAAMGTDFLRSKGYAIPFMGLSVEKMVEYGWIKLTE